MKKLKRCPWMRTLKMFSMYGDNETFSMDEAAENVATDENTEFFMNKKILLNYTQLQSLLFSLLLQNTGYGLKCIQARQARQAIQPIMNIQLGLVVSAFPNLNSCTLGDILTVRTVGSTGEGISNSFPSDTSDTDIMLCLNNVVCFDNDADYTDDSKYIAVFLGDRIECSAGYTKFHLIKCTLDDINSLIADSSKLKHLVNIIPQLFGKTFISTSGPALTCTIYQNLNSLKEFARIMPATLKEKCYPNEHTHTILSMMTNLLGKPFKHQIDFVLAIPYICRDIMHNWVRRKRRYGWPPESLIHDIEVMPGYLVPVGHVSNRTEEDEWRICYTPSELKLIQSLNEVQMMLYVTVKVYANRVIRLICPDIVTSYHVKNIIFWIAECVDPIYFQYENILPLLQSTFVILRSCVEKKCLPNYMIPQRNLFLGKLDDDDTRHNLLVVLNGLIQAKPDITQFEDGRLIIRNINKISNEDVKNSCLQVHNRHLQEARQSDIMAQIERKLMEDITKLIKQCLPAFVVKALITKRNVMGKIWTQLAVVTGKRKLKKLRQKERKQDEQNKEELIHTLLGTPASRRRNMSDDLESFRFDNMHKILIQVTNSKVLPQVKHREACCNVKHIRKKDLKLKFQTEDNRKVIKNALKLMTNGKGRKWKSTFRKEIQKMNKMTKEMSEKTREYELLRDQKYTEAVSSSKLLTNETHEITSAETHGLASSETHGLAHGESQGLASGETYGLAYGETHVLAYGETHGLAYGETNGLAHGEPQGLAYGETHGLATSETR